METPEILQFIADRVQKGLDKKEIKEQLTAVGWSDDEVDDAYTQALKGLGVPTPKEGVRATFSKKTSTLEIVLNLFSFILLGIIAFALGILYFEIIDKYFPDALNDNKAYYLYNRGSTVSTDAVHYSIAALIIGFPLFFFVIRFWFRKFRQDTGRVESRLTKWVTYVVLLVAAVTIVGDLIAILFTFLQGELSARFFLKAFTILAITGMIFGFYFLERRRVQYKKDIAPSVFRIYATVVGIVIVLGIILGFIVAGSPKTERMRTLDDRREQNLLRLSVCIDRYAREFKRLPETLEDLRTASQGYSACPAYTDPETGKSYEYRIVTASERKGSTREGAYELCATFALASDDTVNTSTSYSIYDYGYNSEDIWRQHGAGRECDEHKVVLATIKAINIGDYAGSPEE